jgi:hypothetical protein
MLNNVNRPLLIHKMFKEEPQETQPRQRLKPVSVESRTHLRHMSRFAFLQAMFRSYQYYQNIVFVLFSTIQGEGLKKRKSLLNKLRREIEVKLQETQLCADG